MAAAAVSYPPVFPLMRQTRAPCLLPGPRLSSTAPHPFSMCNELLYGHPNLDFPGNPHVGCPDTRCFAPSCCPDHGLRRPRPVTMDQATQTAGDRPMWDSPPCEQVPTHIQPQQEWRDAWLNFGRPVPGPVVRWETFEDTREPATPMDFEEIQREFEAPPGTGIALQTLMHSPVANIYQNQTLLAIGKHVEKHRSSSTGCMHSDKRKPLLPQRSVSLDSDTANAALQCDLIFERLHESGFYFSDMSSDTARHCLRRWPVGTWLLRKSSDPNHMLALSVSTPRGVTSVRLTVTPDNEFRLDCQPSAEKAFPTFKCPIMLVEHYIAVWRRSASKKRTTGSCVFMEKNGRCDTPMVLSRPYRRSPPTLKALCRRSANAHSPDKEALYTQLPLVNSLIKYLKQYPYAI